MCLCVVVVFFCEFVCLCACVSVVVCWCVCEFLCVCMFACFVWLRLCVFVWLCPRHVTPQVGEQAADADPTGRPWRTRLRMLWDKRANVGIPLNHARPRHPAPRPPNKGRSGHKKPSNPHPPWRDSRKRKSHVRQC